MSDAPGPSPTTPVINDDARFLKRMFGGLASIVVIVYLTTLRTVPPSEFFSADKAGPIDTSITAGMIAGNMRKYAGKRVRLDCTVDDVPDPSFANASCGPSIDEIEASTQRAISNSKDIDAANKAETEGSQRMTEAERADGMLVIRGDGVSDLDKGEKITVVGTVAEPMDGRSGFGVERSFPTVDIDQISKR